MQPTHSTRGVSAHVMSSREAARTIGRHGKAGDSEGVAPKKRSPSLFSEQNEQKQNVIGFVSPGCSCVPSLIRGQFVGTSAIYGEFPKDRFELNLSGVCIPDPGRIVHSFDHAIE